METNYKKFDNRTIFDNETMSQLFYFDIYNAVDLDVVEPGEVYHIEVRAYALQDIYLSDSFRDLHDIPVKEFLATLRSKYCRSNEHTYDPMTSGTFRYIRDVSSSGYINAPAFLRYMEALLHKTSYIMADHKLLYIEFDEDIFEANADAQESDRLNYALKLYLTVLSTYIISGTILTRYDYEYMDMDGSGYYMYLIFLSRTDNMAVRQMDMFPIDLITPKIYYYINKQPMHIQKNAFYNKL